MTKKNKKIEGNSGIVDHSQRGASHLTSDRSQSFNEVSFDVLENAVEHKNSLFGYKSKNFKNKAIISSDEVLDTNKKISVFKKHSDEKSNIGKLTIIVLSIIILLGLCAWSLTYLNDKGYFDVPQHDTELKKAIVQIAKYDKYIIGINEFLKNPINESSINNADFDNEDLENTKTELEELSNKIGLIAKNIDKQSEDYLCVGYAKQTIESRIMMIDTGIKIYENAKVSVDIINKAEAFWDNVLKGDSFLKEADNLVLSNEISNYELAKKNSEEAQSYLNEAKAQVENLNKMGLSFNFDVYVKYIDLKIEASKYSELACQALIDQNVEQIGQMNTKYIEISNQASDLALTMSTTPVHLIRTEYDIKTRPLIEEFKAARKNAADNDFALRNYIYS